MAIHITLTMAPPLSLPATAKWRVLVIISTGDCSNVPYDIIADGVKSLGGHLNLNSPVSFPLDFTTVSLSCSKAGIEADVSKKESGIFRGMHASVRLELHTKELHSKRDKTNKKKAPVRTGA